jgi:hypothetical protein
MARTPHIARVPTIDGAVQKSAKMVNGAVHDARVKIEDQIDEGQLKRLATGVTVDSAVSGVTTIGVSVYIDPCFVGLRYGPAPWETRKGCRNRAEKRPH